MNLHNNSQIILLTTQTSDLLSTRYIVMSTDSAKPKYPNLNILSKICFLQYVSVNNPACSPQCQRLGTI